MAQGPGGVRGEQKGYMSIKQLDGPKGKSHGQLGKAYNLRQSVSFLNCQKRRCNCSSRVHPSGTPTPSAHAWGSS